METKFRQKAKVGVAGSLFNQLMANNASLPKVGEGATELHYTDRTCYEVIEVSADYKTVKLERLEAYADPSKQNAEVHQNWLFKSTGQFITVIWRHNAWRVKSNVVKFTKEFREKAEQAGHFSLASFLTDEQRQAVYGDDIHPRNVVEGITRAAVEYHKTRLLFGVKDYYYDWSF